jgi:hypothetical protein
MASGAGFKTFTNGSILSDADLNDYLMTQAVIICTSGTRPASPHEGMFIYETDANRYQSYNGGWTVVGLTVVGTYTPTLTAVTTNPTLGTGGLASGRYTLWGGKWCTLRGSITFGTSGTNAGSGQYLIALPFQASSAIVGGVPATAGCVIRCAGSVAVTTAFASSGSTTMAMLTTGGNNVASGAPGAWTINDYLSFSFTYEVA